VTASDALTADADARTDFGYRVLVFRRGRLSGRWSRRSAVVGTILGVTALSLTIVAVSIGTYPLSLAQIASALIGTADAQTTLLVTGWRLPRALIALACGVALALSGAIFQSLTRNPLGSPDIIGFSSGSYTGAVVMMLAVGSTRYLDVAAASLVGGCATAIVVYVLATRNGSAQPFRLIIMGIGVGALLSSLNSALMLFVDVDTAMLAAVWAAGSLNGLGYEQLVPLAGVLAILVVALAILAPSIGQLESGDDAARGVGVRANAVRSASVVVGVALTALVTAAAGPISFVALAAPQIARRLTRSPGLNLTSSALVGASVLLASDILAQRLGFPVGVVTAALGGAYLAWLLATEFRRTQRI